MLSKALFDFLLSLEQHPGKKPDVFSEATAKEALDHNYATASFFLTEEGFEQLAPYRVQNAVIMAAGMSSRFAPLSYEKPKGLLTVKGEILIERQIRQLQEAGISDITLVVGYMKEQFSYLADKFGIQIVENEDYSRYNNTSTLIRVTDRLRSTYLCSSDNYFTENVFSPYVYQAYYSAVFSETETDEYCLTCDADGRITGVTIGGGPNAWYMLGHVYFSQDFSDRFVQILKKEYAENPAVREELWEQMYMRHLDELSLYIQKYDSNIIKEFDSLDELRAFDEMYLDHSGSVILTRICSQLNCAEHEIRNIRAIKGLPGQLAFSFTYGKDMYSYAFPDDKARIMKQNPYV